MPRFKAINNSSASIAERIASAGKLVQGEKGMSGPRERAASTDSAVTLLHEEGNDNEDEPQIPKDKSRKSPIKAKDLAPNGGKRWKPEDRLYLWQNRFELGDDKAEKKHEDIGKHLGRTAQACRIELLLIRERIDYRDFAFAISSSFVVKKTTKKQLHAASQLSSPRRAKKQARRKASATRPVCASSPVAQRPLPQFSVSPVKQKIETWDRPQASSLERFPRFRSLLGERVPDMTTPSHLVSATSEPSSVGVQTRAQQRVGFARHLRELGLCDDVLPSVSTVSTATHSDADRDGARALMRLCCGEM